MSQHTKEIIEVREPVGEMYVGVDVLNFPIYVNHYRIKEVEIEVKKNKHITKKKK